MREGRRGEPAAGLRGIYVFTLIWIGQLVSLFGSAMSRFAVGVWVYQESGRVMEYSWIFVSASLPTILLSPVAGAIVDRFDRRRLLLVSDAIAATSTGALLMLTLTGSLEVWQIYVLNVVSAAADAFQVPALSASTTLLVPKRHLARASGAVQVGFALTQIGAPVLAGGFLATMGLAGLLKADLATFVVAAVTLLLVRIPVARRSAEGERARGSLWSESIFGWHYLRRRPGLLALLTLFACTNFANGVLNVLITPLVLSFASPEVLGRVLGFAGAGMLLGSVFITIWGGPKRPIPGIFAFLVGSTLVLLLGGVEPSAVLVSCAAFVFLSSMPVVNSISQALWQRKVEPDLQGRVFAFRRAVATATMPISYLLAGPLADFVFEPLMAEGGPLANSLGRVIGTGEGRGLGLMILALGAFLLITYAIFWSNPRLRNLDEEIPDAIGDSPAEVVQ